MLEILVVDDSERKQTKIHDVLDDYVRGSKCHVSKCASVMSAKTLLAEKQYDLAILDVQLPLRDGEDPLREGGLDLLRELHERTSFHKPTCIVGLTEFEDVLATAIPRFEDVLWSVILFDASSDEWSERLIRKVEYLLEQKACRRLLEPSAYDLGIVVALRSPEFESLLKIGSWSEHKMPGDEAKYVTTKFASPSKTINVIATCAPQMGMPAAAVSATKLITHFHPRYMAMIGITGGVNGKVDLGDVIVADPCWDWGSGKLIPTAGGASRLEPDPLPERLHPHLKTMLMDVQGDREILSQVQNSWSGKRCCATELKLHVGQCVSGSPVVADRCTVEGIKEHSRKLIGVDMEAYGVMLAGANAIEPRPFTFSLKGVCDFADSKKDDAVQEYAAFVSATLLHKIALKYFNPISPN